MPTNELFRVDLFIFVDKKMECQSRESAHRINTEESLDEAYASSMYENLIETVLVG